MNNQKITIDTLYDVDESTVDNSKKMFTEKIGALFLLVILLFTSLILETRILFNIDVEQWKIEKCNPKYIFFSGFIRQNDNLSALETTQDNFNECMTRYAENKFEKTINEKNEEQMKNENESIRDSIKQREIALNERRKRFNNDEKVIAMRADVISKKNHSTMENIQLQLLEMNKIMSDFKEYLHSYLTYAIMNFVVKYKKQTIVEEKNNVSCNNYNENDCNDQKTCIYKKLDGQENASCVKKSDFFRNEANRLNVISKKIFDGNKL